MGATPCLNYLDSGSAKWGMCSSSRDFYFHSLWFHEGPAHPLVTHGKDLGAIFNSSLSLNPTLSHSSNPVHFI